MMVRAGCAAVAQEVSAGPTQMSVRTAAQSCRVELQLADPGCGSTGLWIHDVDAEPCYLCGPIPCLLAQAHMQSRSHVTGPPPRQLADLLSQGRNNRTPCLCTQ